jgi:FkbM family methyltransferase
MMGRLYRSVAEACAVAIARTPALEAPFTRIGPKAWSTPGLGRFYRSVAHRVADRARAAGSPFRPLVVDGVSLVLDATEFTTLSLYFGGQIYEAVTTRYLVSHLQRGGVFVDIGANHGYFSMIAGAVVGERGRVFAFEPNPAVYAQLEAHVRLNGFESRVVLSQTALSDAANPAATFFVSQVRRNSGLSSLSPSADALADGGLSEAHTIPVCVDTFDNWFSTSGLARVDLLKMDVEGNEARLIAGMRQTLAAGSIDELILETVWGSPAHEALCGHGYRPRALDPVGSLCNVLYVRPGSRA